MTTARKPAGMSHADWVEALLAQARQDGAFDQVAAAPDPMAGVDLDAADDEHWWLRRLLEREQLRVPHAATTVRHRIATLAEDLPRIPDAATLQARLRALNEEIARIQLTDSSPLTYHLAALDPGDWMRRWCDARAARSPRA